MATTDKKLILVLCATGAQGMAVCNALLLPSEDGTPSPYGVRALTRDPKSERAQQLASWGCELFQGNFTDFDCIREAVKGCWGIFCQTDGFTVGEEREAYSGIRIWEIAKMSGCIRTFVYSNLDYSLKAGNWDWEYRCDHHEGKSYVGDWMQAQPSVVSDDDMSWSCLSTCVYMDMLNIAMLGPHNVREDGTYVFAAPIGDGEMPLITLRDLGWWARYSFDHRAEVSGQDLKVCSDWVGWDKVVETFKKVTGKKAIRNRQTISQWMDHFGGLVEGAPDKAIALDFREAGKSGKEYTTLRKNFTGYWMMWSHSSIKRDMEWIRKTHPGTWSLEDWMRNTNYTGNIHSYLLKCMDFGKTGLRNDVCTDL